MSDIRCPRCDRELWSLLRGERREVLKALGVYWYCTYDSQGGTFSCEPDWENYGWKHERCHWAVPAGDDRFHSADATEPAKDGRLRNPSDSGRNTQ